jgi:archaellum component FlaG (FlaF/FlaG flagellin family)
MVMLKRSRAVSEVIASLIIILIVSVLGTSLYSYTLTETQLKQDALQRDVQMESERAQERFSVIACVQDGNLLNLTVLNYGSFDIEIVDVYINGDRFTLSPSKRILPSDLGHISITVPAIIPDEIYEITVVSERGVSYVYNWKA